MKLQRVFTLLAGGIVFACCATAAKADTVVVRQPGLVEAVGQAAVGTVFGAAEMCKGLVCGSTTVINVPQTTTPTVVTTSAGTVVQRPAVVTPTVVTPAPVVVAPAPVVVTQPVVYPAVPVVPYYRPYYRPYWRPCPYYYRPYCW